MKQITTRYGASVDLTITITDEDAASAAIYVGNAGEAPKITKTTPIVGGAADLSLAAEDTQIPLGTYKYQINVTYSDGRVKKFPEPQYTDQDNLPLFIVAEALDETEVTS